MTKQLYIIVDETKVLLGENEIGQLHDFLEDFMQDDSTCTAMLRFSEQTTKPKSYPLMPQYGGIS